MDISKKLEGSLLDSSKLNSSFASIKNSVADSTVKATENVKQFVQENATNTTAIFGLIAVIVLAFIVGYGLYYYISRNIFKNIKQVVEETKLPIFANELTKVSAAIEPSGNGERRSYTFWIYINDMNKYSGLYKHVLHVGDDREYNNSSPVIFLDKSKNAMFVRFAPKTPTTSITKLSELTDATKMKTYMKTGIIIPYIPLQRWVHIGIVMNTNSSGGTITTYVDGDISNMVVNNTLDTKYNEITGVSNSDNKTNYSSLNLDKSGSLIIGGNPTDGSGNGFSGLISKFTTYNHDLNQKDIYKDYNEGPIDSIFARLGLGTYGIRSPIYKL